MVGAYFFADFYTSLFMIKTKELEEKRLSGLIMILHHVLGLTLCSACLLGGYGFVTTGQLVTMLEYSTVCINYRYMMSLQEHVSVLGIINIISFINLFVIFRVMLLPFASWKLYMVYTNTWTYLSPLRRGCFYFGMTQFALLIVMNYYWFFLILQKIAQIAGLIKKEEEAS